MGFLVRNIPRYLPDPGFTHAEGRISGLPSKCVVQDTFFVAPADSGSAADSSEWQPGDPFRLRTTLGRALFNELLPEDYPFVDYAVGKKQLSEIVNDLAERYPKVVVAATLDNLKAAGFFWQTRF